MGKKLLAAAGVSLLFAGAMKYESLDHTARTISDTPTAAAVEPFHFFANGDIETDRYADGVVTRMVYDRDSARALSTFCVGQLLTDFQSPNNFFQSPGMKFVDDPCEGDC
jgi:hypothetical protein